MSELERILDALVIWYPDSPEEGAAKDSVATLATQLNTKLEAMKELKEAVEAFKADDTWKFDPAHIGRGLMTWGEVLTALAAAQQEKEDE